MTDNEFDKWWDELCKEIDTESERGVVDFRTAQYRIARRILQTCLGDQSEDRSISDICDE